MNISEIWQTIAPYVISGVGFIFSASGMAIIGRFTASAVTKKIQSKNLAKAVANELGGTQISVSLESVNKAQINALKEEVNEHQLTTQDMIAKQNRVLIAQSKVLLHNRHLSDEEKQELIAATNAIAPDEAKIKTPISNVVTVELTPVAEEDKVRETKKNKNWY